jgi:hypothetical protein
MRYFRLSLLELLIGTALAGLSCAALVKANGVIVNVTFFVLLLGWVIATAIAVNPQAKNRPFWLAFLIMSLVVHYHASSFQLGNALVDAWEAIYGPEDSFDPFADDPFGVALVALPDPPSTSVMRPSRVAFVATARSLLCLWSGLLSGLLARAIHRSTQIVSAEAKNT